jgi:hypothetical protein
MIALPSSAHGYRRGLASSFGGATLDSGHVAWIALGYPDMGLGWGMALHPRVDLLVGANVVLGHPAQVDRLVVGGGGGLVARFGLIRGRTSLAATARLSATAYGEGGGVAALVELLSPGVDLSFRLGPAVALHAGIRLVLEYITEPAAMIGGFEAHGAVSVRLSRHLGLVGGLSVGGSLQNTRDSATARAQATVGLEYLFARDDSR